MSRHCAFCRIIFHLSPCPHIGIKEGLARAASEVQRPQPEVSIKGKAFTEEHGRFLIFLFPPEQNGIKTAPNLVLFCPLLNILRAKRGSQKFLALFPSPAYLSSHHQFKIIIIMKSTFDFNFKKLYFPFVPVGLFAVSWPAKFLSISTEIHFFGERSARPHT